VAEIGARRWAAAVRIDQPDDDDARAGRADTPDAVEARDADAAACSGFGSGDAGHERAVPAASPGEHVAYRVQVDAVFRAYAIDQAYDRVRDIERTTVTPAMKRIEAEDPERRLAGLEHSLKGKDRLTEKITKMVNELGHPVDQAIGLVKDAIRYTFCYPEARYGSGVDADCERLQTAGFQLVDRENSWTAEQYKGINSRWREPESGQLFEVQFHTQASLDAKEETHWAYEKLRVGVPTPAEQRELEDFQKQVTACIPVPPGAADIADYP
jgi:hypothetical protein